MKMETTITPWPREIVNKMKFETFAIGYGTHIGQNAFYVRKSDNFGKEQKEIVTMRNGEKMFHRYTGNTKRAMKMILLSIGAINEAKIISAHK